jgi:hypothetical protein
MMMVSVNISPPMMMRGWISVLTMMTHVFNSLIPVIQQHQIAILRSGRIVLETLQVPAGLWVIAWKLSHRMETYSSLDNSM